MAPPIYIETSIISYLVSRPSRDALVAEHQALTRTWWDTRRTNFSLYCSHVVLTEAARGDSEPAQRRIAALEGIPPLGTSPTAVRLAHLFMASGCLPPDALDDALHMAIAASQGMDYLLTWNCAHIANAEILRVINRICYQQQIEPPTICTPLELMGGTS